MTTIVVPADADRVVPADAVAATVAAITRASRDVGALPRLFGAADDRVRLVSVDTDHSLVLFVLEPETAPPDLVIAGVFPSPSAEAFAMRALIAVHPATGVPHVRSTVGRAEPAAPPAESLLAARGMTLTQLVDDLGVEPDLAREAMSCTDPRLLLDVAGRAPQRTQGETLRLLGAGTTPSAVRQHLEFEAVPAGQAGSDEVVHRALRSRASRMNYALLDAAEPGDLEWMLRGLGRDQWRAFLHPAQRRHVEARHSGPARVVGGPGTGKTVVLIHRARELCRRYPGSRIVLTTFTRNLADRLRDDLRRLDPRLPLADRLGNPGLYVATVDSVVATLLHRYWRDAAASVAAVLGCTLSQARPPVLSDRAAAVWQAAISSASGVPGWLRHEAFFTQEYESVILPARLQDVGGYRRVKRVGRGKPLDQRVRTAVWGVVEDYRSALRADDLLDLAETSAVIAHHLQTCPDSPLPVDHVLVDEAQDLSICNWRLIRAMTVPGPDDVLSGEDARQRIYARAPVGADIGMRFTRTQTLDLSYRTTVETLDWADRIIDGSPRAAEQSGVCRAIRSGEAPRLIGCESARDERRVAIDILREWLRVAPADDIGVLVRANDTGVLFGAALDDAGIPWQQMGHSDSVAPGRISVMTMHRAKGIEFPRILIVGAGKGELPARPVRRLGLDLGDDALERERSLVYVAATRARDALAVTWTREPSELLPSMPWGDPLSPKLALTRPGMSWTHEHMSA